MKKLVLIVFLVSLSSCKSVSSQLSSLHKSKTEIREKKKKADVIILATGGTIAGKGESATEASYKAGEVPIEELLEAVPEIHENAVVKGEQIANIGSQDMNIETWLKLSNRINEIFSKGEAKGVVITHGTDTMEETAYFLSLTIQSDHPVVLVGAMRPATALSQDGNRNLLDAVTVAASPKSENIGVVVAMNEQIMDARGVEKTSTTNTSAFQSPNFGPIGTIFDGEVNYYYKVNEGSEEKFDVRKFGTLPKVDILYGYAGAPTGAVSSAVKYGSLGLIYAGVGNGNFSQEVEEALAKAVDEGVVVVRSSRIGKGRVTLNNEVDDKKHGFLVADNLSPQKARILLMLALTKTQDLREIQDLFFTY